MNKNGCTLLHYFIDSPEFAIELPFVSKMAYTKRNLPLATWIRGNLVSCSFLYFRVTSLFTQTFMQKKMASEEQARTVYEKCCNFCQGKDAPFPFVIS